MKSILTKNQKRKFEREMVIDGKEALAGRSFVSS